MRRGVLPFSAEQGLELFDAALTAGAHHPVLVAGVLDGAGAATTGGSPLLRSLARTSTQTNNPNNAATPSPDTATEAATLRRRLAGEDPKERARLLLNVIRAEAAVVLGHATAGAVPADRGFLDLGFDSLGALELRNRLAAATGLRHLPSTAAFDHPTPVRLAEHLSELIEVDATDNAHTARTTTGNANGTNGTNGATGTHSPEPSTPESPLTTLSRLEAHLSTEEALPDETRAALETRLRGLLTRIAAPGRLDTATDDEVFSFIENELGIS